MELPLREVARVGLGNGADLDRSQRGPGCLDLLDHADQLGVGLVGPPRGVEIAQSRRHVRDHVRWAATGTEL